MGLNNINADKIASGTLDASKVDIINLDDKKITGNKTLFVQSAWNGLKSTVSIDDNGVHIKNTLDD